MERTKTKVEDGTILWQKTGGGTFRLPSGKIIKPTQKFRARPNEIPEAFRDTVIPLDKVPPTPEEIAPDVEEPTYDLKHRGGGWYDIIDSNGKTLNEKALKQEEAEELIESLKA